MARSGRVCSRRFHCIASIFPIQRSTQWRRSTHSFWCVHETPAHPVDISCDASRSQFGFSLHSWWEHLDSGLGNGDKKTGMAVFSFRAGKNIGRNDTSRFRQRSPASFPRTKPWIFLMFVFWATRISMADVRVVSSYLVGWWRERLRLPVASRWSYT